MRAAISNLRRLRKLPSIETMTIEFVELARAGNFPSSWLLSRGGFSVYLKYDPEYWIGDKLVGEVLVIARIDTPPRWRRRGWFWRYCQLCLALVRDGIAIEGVYTPWLREALARRELFVEWLPRQFILLKDGPGDWPLLLDAPLTCRVIFGPTET